MVKLNVIDDSVHNISTAMVTVNITLAFVLLQCS